MCTRCVPFLLAVILFVPFMLGPLSGPVVAGAIVADHNAVAEFDDIPLSVIEQVADDYRIYYGHTSHGSQIMTGLDMVEAENAAYAQPYCREVSDDLGHGGDTSWVPITRSYLDSHGDINVVMWSWCGGCSDNTEAGINIYLNAMNGLEADYPTVTFIYMTGHLDGGGVDGNLYQRNNQIRNYCNAHNKVLFDFADVESWDPDGTYYPDETDACGWCSVWCGSHSCPGCERCAHSHCFNCFLKGKAFWWLMATVSGWSLGSAVDDEKHGELPKDYLLHQNYPNPFNPVTRISFDLPVRSGVRLTVYNVAGQKVATLVDGVCRAGRHTVEWAAGEAASGVYLYRLETAEFTLTKKMLLLK